MLYGVSYYWEYQPFERLDEDIAMMVEAKINYARVGDSIWALCEPVEGRFELDWLQRVLDALHEAGIKIIFTTPTYAIPPWLHRLHPEVMRQGPAGNPVPYGARQNFELTNPAYRHYAERITRRLLARYAQHPGIIGFQVDNETETFNAQNPSVIEAFRQYLKDRFGTVDVLNEIWGLTYWSHRLGDWSDLWPPAGNTNPGYDLEWRRFNAKLTTDHLAWQKGIVAEYARDDQFVMHDIPGLHAKSNTDRYAVSAVMDINAENFPHATQDALAHPPVEGLRMYPAQQSGAGAVQLYQRSAMAYGARRSNFYIAEMNPISIANSDNVFPCYDGQWRMAAFSTISRGADMVAYWHWHSLHYGQETYSHGILNHDLGPNRNYDEVKSIGHDLDRHGELLTGLNPDSEVAFVYSYDSLWALACQPPFKTADGSRGNTAAYQKIFDTFFRGFFDARAQSIVLPPQADLEGFPVVVVPALYIADDATIDWLIDYAERGGHLVLTFRTGYADEYARARWLRAPGRLAEPAGVSYNLYSNLASPVGVRGSGGLQVPDGATADFWMDELVVSDDGSTEVLAAYDHPHFGRFPAVTSHRYGSGRVSYVGTLPDAAFARSIAEWVLQSAGVTPRGAGLPEPVRVTGATARDGSRMTFVSNWSNDPQDLPADLLLPAIAGNDPAQGTELFSSQPVGPGGRMQLGPWDIRIIREQ